MEEGIPEKLQWRERRKSEKWSPPSVMVLGGEHGNESHL